MLPFRFPVSSTVYMESCRMSFYVLFLCLSCVLVRFIQVVVHSYTTGSSLTKLHRFPLYKYTTDYLSILL